MSDPLTWSPISLGRWFGTSVRVHITLIIFVVFRLMSAAVSLAAKGELPQLSQTACWLGLLLLALALHELGHAVTASWLDCDQEDVHIWPLGSLVGPSFAPRSSEHFLVAMAGPVDQRGDCPGDRPGLEPVRGCPVRLEPVRQRDDGQWLFLMPVPPGWPTELWRCR